MKRKPTIQERALESLLERMTEYEEYFESLDAPDNPAQAAYLDIIKTVMAIAKEMPKKTDTSKTIKEKFDRAMREEYGIKRS